MTRAENEQLFWSQETFAAFRRRPKLPFRTIRTHYFCHISYPGTQVRRTTSTRKHVCSHTACSCHTLQNELCVIICRSQWTARGLRKMPSRLSVGGLAEIAGWEWNGLTKYNTTVVLVILYYLLPTTYATCILWYVVRNKRRFIIRFGYNICWVVLYIRCVILCHETKKKIMTV